MNERLEILASPRAYLLFIDHATAAAPLIEQLPEWRRERALAFRHEQGQKECALSFLLLRDILREEFGINDTELRFSLSEKGKPTLADHPDIHFNLSHCKQAVACVVADHPVGIDIESCGRYRDSLARHTMNDTELEQIKNADNPDLAFTRLWTQKEALAKLSGEGLASGLKQLLPPTPPTIVRTTEIASLVCSVAY